MSSALHLHLLAFEEQNEEAGAPFVEPASNELEGGPFVEPASNELEAASPEAEESPGIEVRQKSTAVDEEIEEEPHCNAVLVAEEVPSELHGRPIAVSGAVAGPVECCPLSMDLNGTSVQGHLCMHHVSTNIKTPASSPRAPPHKEGLIGD